MVAGPVEEMMDVVILCVTCFEEGPRVQQRKGDSRHQDRGEEGVGKLEPKGAQLPRGEDAQSTIDPSQIPVGLSRRRHLLRLERPVEPHRVDLH